MPVHQTSKGCYQWGNHGKVYCGKDAARKAYAQASAAMHHGYREGGASRRSPKRLGMKPVHRGY